MEEMNEFLIFWDDVTEEMLLLNIRVNIKH